MEPSFTFSSELPLIQYSSFRLNFVFTTRKGGVSEGKFESLNLSFKVGDVSKRVRENREKLGRFLNLNYRLFTFPEQVHGSKIAQVGLEDAGKGALSEEGKVPGVDGLFTKELDLPLCVLVADCLPVIITDADENFVAVVHAGWRGLKSGIIFNAINFAEKNFKARPQSLRAWIGPSIGVCCYEVGGEVAESFSNYPLALKRVEGRHFLDLKFLGRWQLLEGGLRESEVWVAPNCTFCEKDFFYSYRREKGKTGRQAAIAWLSSGERKS
jgi:hypothetical protein